MKISGIDELDIGMSNIEIEGEVTYTEVPEHREGVSKKGKKEPYNFWSQFIVVDDGTGKMGCNVSVKDEDDGLTKGVIARVKGKLKEWEGKRSIQGKLIAISKGDKVTDVQQERAEEYFDEKAKEEKKEAKPVAVAKPVSKPENNVWEEKDLRIARECAIKAVTELVCAKIMKNKDFFNFADSLVKYIYNGNNDKPKIIKEHGKLEVKDENALFPGEEPTKEELAGVEKAVNEKEEAGSSIDNALPFKGKKKALKKVSNVKDFVAASDIPE